MQAATWTALGACVGVTIYGATTGDLHAPSGETLLVLFAVVLAAIFLGERVEPLVALGGLAVLAGAVLAALTVPAVDAERELTPPQRWRPAPIPW